ncbi:hypothetical protein B5E42_08480 [Flavonifractor sp. An10]|nr:hypothetical protein B5E42_08480 [Flavonifractor sp. An10]
MEAAVIIFTNSARVTGLLRFRFPLSSPDRMPRARMVSSRVSASAARAGAARDRARHRAVSRERKRSFKLIPPSQS